VVLYASGGLSHFTAGYPWPYYKGPYSLGAISQDYDRRLIDLMLRGHGHELAELTTRGLLDNGEIELRQWITMLGAIGNHKPQQLVYEPFYRGVLGMAVGYWDLSSA
jgi:aromatic ring-opening dioxygenase LigB subunit